MSRRQFGMFAKYWEPGQVKTRLAATIGDEAAAELHHCFVRRLAVRFATVADQRVICYAPSDKGAAFDALAGSAWCTAPQIGGDLGQRMKAYFDQAFEAGMERVVLIGSDSPALSAVVVEEAFEKLNTHPVVLGPSLDGGYYLVGAQGQTPPIFTEIAWSTAAVWEQTQMRLQEAKLEGAVLAPTYDVDTFEDLPRLQQDLEIQSDPADGELRRRIDQLLGEH